MKNKVIHGIILSYFSEFKILDGKYNLYKRGYHILQRRVKRIAKDNKNLRKEVSRLDNILQTHEDLMFAFL